MNFQLNKNLGNWLSQFNHMIVERIYKVDYNEGSKEDNYLPWLYYLTFKNWDKFLQIEGDFDGEHIQLDVYGLDELNTRLKENVLILKSKSELWGIYTVAEEEKLALLVNRKIERIQYGIEKDYFTINGEVIQGQKNFFTFIRFYTEKEVITVSESTGLFVSDDPNFQLNFKGSFDVFEAK